MTLFNGIAQIKNCKKIIPILTKHLEIRIALTNKISGCETSMIMYPVIQKKHNTDK